jgi:hypothetical protein
MNTDMLIRRKYTLCQAGVGAVREPPLQAFETNSFFPRIPAKNAYILEPFSLRIFFSDFRESPHRQQIAPQSDKRCHSRESGNPGF